MNWFKKIKKQWDGPVNPNSRYPYWHTTNPYNISSQAMKLDNELHKKGSSLAYLVRKQRKEEKQK